MPTIADYRNKFPSLRDLDDAALIDRVAQVQGVPREDVIAHMGYKPKSRGILSVLNDTVIEGANAVAGGVGSVANFVAPGNPVSEFIDENIIKAGEAKQSDVVKAEKAAYRADMDAAEGIGDEIGATLGYVARNPLQSLAQAAGSFVLPGAAVKGGGMLASMAGAGAKGATRAGLAGGAAAGAALSGGDAAGTAYELVKKAGGTDEQAEAAAREASVLPAAIGAAGGLVGAERLVAGAKGFGGGALSRALKTAGVEGVQEAVEEGVTQYEGQAAAAPYDPTIDPMKGVAGAATMGAVLGGATGGAVSLLSGEPAKEAKPDPVAKVLAAPSVDAAIQAATEGLTGAKKPAPAELPQMDAEDRREVLGLMQVVNRPGVSPNVARFAQARMDALLAPYRSIPTGEATEMLPVPDVRELTDEERAEYANAVPFSYRRALERGLPQPEVTELLPTGDATEVEPIPVGDAFEEIPAPEAYETLPVGEAAELIPTGDTYEQPARKLPVGKATELEAETIQADDLLAKDGEPFVSKTGAQARAFASGGGKVVTIPNHFGSGQPGYVVRPLVPAQPNNTRGTNAGDVARTAGQRADDAGRGDGTAGVPDQRPGNVLASPAKPAGQGVDGAGAAGGAAARTNALTVQKGLTVSFGGKTYPVQSVEDAREKWERFRDSADGGGAAGVSQIGNGVEVRDGAGNFVARISYNGRVWDTPDDGPTKPAASPTLTEGQRVTLNGTPYTVTAANNTAVKLQGADGATKMVARGSKTFQAIQQEPNEAARPQTQAAAGESAAPAAAPATAAPAVVPGATSTGVEADGVKSADDYLTELFGTPAEQEAAQARFMAAEAQRKQDEAKATEAQRADAKRIRDAIGGEKKRAQAEYDDWSSRTYKANKTQVELRGDGPSNQASMSIGAINESRRRNAMEALSQELKTLDKLERGIADDAGAAQFMSAMRALYERAEKIAAGGNGLFKTPGEQFQYMLLDDLKFRGPAGRGNVTSNGLSKAVLAAIKPEAATPAAAPAAAPATLTPKAQAVKEALAVATHKDPGEPAEPVTPAVVREAIKTGVQDTGRKPSAMRAELLREIDRAIEEAPDYGDYQAMVKTMGAKDAAAVMMERGEIGAPPGYSRPKRTFKVEGDGVFTIQNSVRQLLKFRAQVEKSPGFKDRQAPAGLNERATDTLDRRSTDAAIANMVEEGDFQAALDYAEAKEVDIGAVKLTKVLRDRLEKWQKNQVSAKAVADYEAARAEGKPAPGSLAAAFAEKEAEAAPAPAAEPAADDIPEAGIASQTFDQWVRAKYAGNEYKARYLDEFGGDERRAILGAAIGTIDNDRKTPDLLKEARAKYHGELLALPRETTISLEVWDALDSSMKYDAQRHFYDLDTRITRRTQDETKARVEAERIKKAPYEAAFAEVDAEIRRLDALPGPETQKQKNLSARRDRLRDALYQIGQGKEPDGRLLRKEAAAPAPAAQAPAGQDEQPEAQALTLEAIPKSLQITLEVEGDDGKVMKKVVGARRAYLAAQQRVQKLQALKECVG